MLNMGQEECGVTTTDRRPRGVLPVLAATVINFHIKLVY